MAHIQGVAGGQDGFKALCFALGAAGSLAILMPCLHSGCFGKRAHSLGVLSETDGKL